MLLVSTQQSSGRPEAQNVLSKKICSPKKIQLTKVRVSKLLKFEKRQSFNTYLKEAAETKDVKILYSSLKRLSPKFKWNVNTGSQ
jgi:hypothetical protein